MRNTMTVGFKINGFEINPKQEIDHFVAPIKGQIIQPFEQNYKYRVKSMNGVTDHQVIIDLEPFCENAKELFKRQYKQQCNMGKLNLQQISMLIDMSLASIGGGEHLQKLIEFGFVSEHNEITDKGNRFLKLIVNLSETM